MSVFNFSAGPAMLPKEVLLEAQAEMLDYHGTGMSVMSMSHRSQEFMSIAEQAEANLRDLMEIANNYKVLFVQGGATNQFALLPLNLGSASDVADYVCTGIWSKKAIAHAKPLIEVNVAASGEDGDYLTIPKQAQWKLNEDAAYLHYTDNETIGGIEFQQTPSSLKNVPLVCDMSSSILSKQIEVSNYGVIYAGAQKNIGPAGLTIVIIRDDLLERNNDAVSPILSYRQHARANSMLNTPPTYSWYIAGLVFKWLKQLGGVEYIAKMNVEKSELLYTAIDDSAFYANPIEAKDRSKMNVPFTLADPQLDKLFLEKAAEANLLNLTGHRSIGGMRASIYNAMPIKGVQKLVSFMEMFEKQYA